MELTPLQRLFAKLTPPSGTIWLDGRAVSLSLEVEIIKVFVTAAEPMLILPEDIGRVWIGFQEIAASANSIWVSPNSRPLDFYFAKVDGLNGLVTFRLQDYPGILGSKWYGQADFDEELTIYNVRQARK